MSIAWGVALATMVPFMCLALLLFLDRLEETLTRSRRPAPVPSTTAPAERRAHPAA